MVILILSDVTNARDKQFRDDYIQKVDGVIRAINNNDHDLLGRASRYNGDRIGIVLRPVRYQRCYAIVKALHDGMRPLSLRTAIVTGEVDLGLHTHDPAKMGGSAFDYAAEVLEEIKQTPGTRVGVNISAEMAHNLALTTMVHQLLDTRSRWTDNMLKTIHAVESHPSQAAAAKSLGVGAPSVSKSLKRANYASMLLMEQAVHELLKITTLHSSAQS